MKIRVIDVEEEIEEDKEIEDEVKELPPLGISIKDDIPVKDKFGR